MKRSLSLRHKLALLITGVIAVLTLLSFVYLDVRLRAEALRSARDEARRLAELTSFTVSPALLFDDVHSAREALAPACRSSIVSGVEVLDGGDRSFARCTGAGPGSSSPLIATVPVISADQKIGTLRLALSTKPLADQIAASRRGLAGISLVVFAAGVAMALAISHFVTRPLHSITETAEAIRGGDMSRRVETRSKDEVGALARTFNSMLDEMELNRLGMEELNHSLELTVERRTREVTLLLQSTYDGIVAVDEGGRCVMMNRAAASALGQPPFRAIGHDVHELLHPYCSRADCSLASLLHARSGHQSKETFYRFDGSSLSVDLTVAPVLDGEQITGTVMTFRDVSERDELHRQLEQASRLSSLGTLAAKVAHEFNNVLMGILPFVEMMRRAAVNDERMVKWSDTIAQSVNRGKRITQEVLRFTRPQPLQRRPLTIARWLEEFAPTLRVTAGKSVSTTVVVHDDEMIIEGDREQLEQLLINLVSNARDAMPEGGTVGIEAFREGYLCGIRVRDNGPGMTAEVAKRVFEPFFTTKKLGGTGLGLSVADQIVKAHRGSIDLETTPEEGTTFTVRIPLSNEAAAAAALPERPSREALRGRVLVVEDDAAVAAGIRALLEQNGAAVEVALTGQAATLSIRQQVPNAIVLDIGLPDIDGVVLYRTIAASHPDLPVIFSTGHGDQESIRSVLRRPNVRFLMKPYTADALLSAIGDVMLGQVELATADPRS
jgi:PAS domain S-box-containing protein